MTTIAWDGTTLAGDRQSTSGGTPTRTRKVFKVSRDGRTFLFACAGITAQCQEYARWAFGERDMPKFTDFQVMVIDERGHIWIAGEDLLWGQKGTARWAIGCGADYALGAMAAGANAEQAVRIAMKLDVNTGLGLDKVKFTERQSKKQLQRFS